MPKPTPVTVCGNSAEVVIGGRVNKENAAECQAPYKEPKRQIRIRGKLRGEYFLDCLIHECVHLAGWHIREEFVEKFAEDMAAIILHPDFEERIFGEE